ncbi:hypothetical protein [Perlucidibaca aquatica]|uniref:hypothetical protein n=1 Tax=Perlucidibaca aquatica TaxID=1852776 RepID=UPI00083A1482|nr:hypothetical protein [Perlucidibaca aquatica]
MRFLLVPILLLIPVTVLAAEPVSPPTPTVYVSPFNGYQGWTEPAVRDWQETHALVADEPTGHAGHSMGSMGSPATSNGDVKEEAPKSPAESHDMPVMKHGGH